MACSLESSRYQPRCIAVFGRDILRCFRGPHVFVDKICIPQEDKQLQRDVIKKLGAFLRCSDTMMICYTDLYLTKLWTVYELATYVSLYKTDGRLRLVHCAVPQAVLVVLTMIYVFDMAILAMQATLSDSASLYAEYGGDVFILFVVSFCFRWVAKEKLAILDRIQRFTVYDCTCFVEADREVVYNNITSLMQATCGIQRPKDEALARFDEMVRTELPPALDVCFGRYGFTNGYLISLPFVWFMPRVADAILILRDRPWKEWVVEYVLWYVAVIFWLSPILCIVIQTIASLQLKMGGWRSCCFIGLASFVGLLLVGIGIGLVLPALLAWALKSVYGLTTFVAVDVVVPVLMAWVIVRGGGRHSEGKTATESEVPEAAVQNADVHPPCVRYGSGAQASSGSSVSDIVSDIVVDLDLIADSGASYRSGSQASSDASCSDIVVDLDLLPNAFISAKEGLADMADHHLPD